MRTIIPRRKIIVYNKKELIEEKIKLYPSQQTIITLIRKDGKSYFGFYEIFHHLKITQTTNHNIQEETKQYIKNINKTKTNVKKIPEKELLNESIPKSKGFKII